MSRSSTPVAKGSSVPAWPIFTPRGSSRFTFATAAAEEIPAGLFKFKTPSIASTDAGNELRRHPRFGCLLKGIGDLQEHRLAPCSSEKRHPDRQSIDLACRNGDV